MKALTMNFYKKSQQKNQGDFIFDNSYELEDKEGFQKIWDKKFQTEFIQYRMENSIGFFAKLIIFIIAYSTGSGYKSFWIGFIVFIVLFISYAIFKYFIFTLTKPNLKKISESKIKEVNEKVHKGVSDDFALGLFLGKEIDIHENRITKLLQVSSKGEVYYQINGNRVKFFLLATDFEHLYEKTVEISDIEQYQIVHINLRSNENLSKLNKQSLALQSSIMEKEFNKSISRLERGSIATSFQSTFDSMDIGATEDKERNNNKKILEEEALLKGENEILLLRTSDGSFMRINCLNKSAYENLLPKFTH